MSAFRLLIVEDNDQDMATCRDTVARYCDERKREVDLVECRSVEDAFEKLDGSFDGAIIDLRLADQGDEGNQIVGRIAESYFRIPMVILTGTPDAVDSNFAYIGVYKKGDLNAGYADLLDRFWEIHNTGLTRIMGGRGTIEETLNTVFLVNLLPQISKWVEYGKTDSSKTEKALLRHSLNCLLQLLDDDGDRCFPEEVYLTPPLTDKIRTGSVVKKKDSMQSFVVMNPACDLVVHANGSCKTDRILIAEIDSQASLFPNYPATNPSNNQKKDLERAYKNNKTDYYHWLPRTDSFEGGFLNFRKLSSLSKDEFSERFDEPEVQISPSFVKDMVARFSAYYARQGQPEIDYEHFLNPPAVQMGISQ